jgi:DNA-binding protein H-NS
VLRADAMRLSMIALPAAYCESLAGPGEFIHRNTDWRNFVIGSAIGGFLNKNIPKEDEYMTQALQELEAQLRDLNIKLSDAKQKEKQAALAAFKEQVELLGITQQEVLSALGYIVQRKRKAPAKYYDPTTGRSWSGRGPRPKWLEGKDLDTLLVDREARTWWPGDDQG